jgi:hypothetical protein
MKNYRFTLSLAGVAALVTMAFGQVSRAADKAPDCSKEAKKVSASVSDKPENVLKIVAKEVQESPTCVCEIVKAAITASKADKDLVVQIVTTASSILPDETPTIIACAIAASPESARAIADKFGSGKGVSGKEPAHSGKETGKGQPVVEKEEDIWDFGMFHVGVGGIYLTTPSSGLSNSNFNPPVVNPQ